MQWKFYLETFGCRVNQYEGNVLREAWEKAGGQLCERAEYADFILINTCAITSRAERDGRNAVFRLRKLAPDAKIILTGCAAQFYRDFQPRKNANWAMPDFCIPQTAKKLLLKGPQQIISADFAFDMTSLPPIQLESYDRARPVVKIQDGCTQFCTYCIVPQTRGKPRSRQREDILAECHKLASAGYGELVLSGINLRQYAGDFWELLAWLDNKLAPEYAGKLRLRASSLDPAMLDWHALDVISHNKLLCPHLHLSLQHGSSKILAAMGRKHYTAQSVQTTLQNLAAIWQCMGLGADFIVGFPGETEADFEQLLQFVADSPITYAHVFPYSRRQGTKAAQMPGQIPKTVKEQRAKKLRELVQQKKEQFLQKQLAQTAMQIVLEKQGHGVNEYFVPCTLSNPCASIRGLATVRPVAVNGQGLEVMWQDDIFSQDCR